MRQGSEGNYFKELAGKEMGLRIDKPGLERLSKSIQNGYERHDSIVRPNYNKLENALEKYHAAQDSFARGAADRVQPSNFRLRSAILNANNAKKKPLIKPYDYREPRLPSQANATQDVFKLKRIFQGFDDSASSMLQANPHLLNNEAAAAKHLVNRRAGTRAESLAVRRMNYAKDSETLSLRGRNHRELRARAYDKLGVNDPMLFGSKPYGPTNKAFLKQVGERRTYTDQRLKDYQEYKRLRESSLGRSLSGLENYSKANELEKKYKFPFMTQKMHRAYHSTASV